VTRRTSYTVRKEGYAIFDALEDAIYALENQITKESGIEKHNRRNQ